MRFRFARIPVEPYVYVERRSEEHLTRILKLFMNLSRGNIRTLVFHFHSFLSEDQLTYTAERCSGLTRVVLPSLNRIMKSEVIRAIRAWKNLESLTMPSVANPAHFLAEIAKNCKNFKELKIMGPFDMVFASALATCLPNIKILSLRCSPIAHEALVKVLEELPGLEMLNISHSYLVKENAIVRILDENIVEKTSRLKNFFYCMNV